MQYSQGRQKQFLKRKNSLLNAGFFFSSEMSLEKLKSVLAVSAKARTEEQIDTLVFYTSHIKVFAELISSTSPDAHRDCCRNLSYEKQPAGKVISRQFIYQAGEEGSKFYIIVTGSCGVLSPLPKKSSNQDYCQLAILRQGDSFGEQALTSHKPRTTSVLCREETSFAVLQRIDYLRILGKTHGNELETKVSFLMDLPAFGSVSKSAVQSFAHFFKRRSYKRNQALCVAGDLVNEVFIITKGEFQLSKAISRSANDLESMTHSDMSDSQYHLQIALITIGEMVGAEELTHSLPHKFSCTCRSIHGEVLCISQEDFLARVTSEDTINYLHNMKKTKENHRLERVLKMQKVAGLSSNNGKQKKDLRKMQKTDRNDSIAKLIKEALLREKDNLSYLPGLGPNRLRGNKVNKKVASLDLQKSASQAVIHPLSTLSKSWDDVKTPKNAGFTGKKSWLEIVESKYSLEKEVKTEHRQPQSVVNFHRQLLRNQAPGQNLELLRLVGNRSITHFTRGQVSFVNLSLEASDTAKVGKRGEETEESFDP